MLCEFYSNPPEEIDEAALEACFLHRRNVDRWSANTLRICYCGIRFYFVKVLQRDWNLFNFLRAKSESRLPAVLSRDEVRALLACVRTPHNRAFLNTVCACGLRLQEALYLEVADIDSDRIMIHVHRRIASCRCPKATLETLRSHWRSHRHPRLLFLSLGSGQPFGGPRHDTHGDQQRPGGVCSAKERPRLTGASSMPSSTAVAPRPGRSSISARTVASSMWLPAAVATGTARSVSRGRRRGGSIASSNGDCPRRTSC